MTRRRAALALTLPLLVAGPAAADEAANTATARALGTDGVLLADDGRCSEAIEKLTRAEALHHAPTTATRLGECEIDVGKIVIGTERLQRLIREPLPPGAPPVFAAAVLRAHSALDKALPRIATLRLSVKTPPGAKIAIAIDDEPAPDAIVDSIRQIDPGTHTIQVRAPGCVAATATATFEEGGTKQVFLELEVDRAAAQRAREAERDGAAPATAASKVPAYVAFSAGALGLAVGTYAAVLVARRAATLANACGPDRVCPEDRQSDITAAKQWATVSTAAFVAGGVGIATGIVLLITRSSAAPEQTRRGVRPSIGLGAVTLDGAF